MSTVSGTKDKVIGTLRQLRRGRIEPCIECGEDVWDEGEVWCEPCRQVVMLAEADEHMALAYMDEGPLPT